jgi:hypothetical protein
MVNMAIMLYTHVWKYKNGTFGNYFKKEAGEWGECGAGKCDLITLYSCVEVSQWNPFVQLIYSNKYI